MDYENLVDEVINELYKRFSKDIFMGTGKKKAILIGNMPGEDYNVLDNIYEVMSLYDVIPSQRDLTEFDCIIICRMTIEMLGNLALGCSHHEQETFILKALLEEKPVYMIEDGLEYKKYKTTFYKALYNLYSEYEKRVIQYGIRPIGYMSELLWKKQDNVYDKYPGRDDVDNFRLNRHERSGIVEHNNIAEADITNKKLLLEADLVKLYARGLKSIKVKRNCIITPAAEDFIKARKIMVQRT